MKYGICYQGSKNKLAERIIALLPRAEHFYDLFAGGCAISHCALLSGKWKHIHISDTNDSVLLFRDALEGNIPDGSEWISREDFYLRKDTNPYIRLVWSFASNQRNYIYSREIEPYKKAVHEMIFAPSPNERRLKFREVCKLIPHVLGLNGGGVQQMCGHESTERLQRLLTGFNTSNRNYPPPISSQSDHYKAYNTTSHTKGCVPSRTVGENRGGYNSIELNRLQSEERRNNCPNPFCGGQYEMRVADYRDIEILPNSIIYADKPYVGTCGYGDTNKDDFDHDAFWSWAEEQEAPVFISEYWAPEDRFFCIAEWERTSAFSATNNALKKIEKLFLPNKWRDWWDKQNPKQKTLFDEL